MIIINTGPSFKKIASGCNTKQWTWSWEYTQRKILSIILHTQVIYTSHHLPTYLIFSTQTFTLTPTPPMCQKKIFSFIYQSCQDNTYFMIISLFFSLMIILCKIYSWVCFFLLLNKEVHCSNGTCFEESIEGKKHFIYILDARLHF